jgi:hypothetical protein
MSPSKKYWKAVFDYRSGIKTRRNNSLPTLIALALGPASWVQGLAAEFLRNNGIIILRSA